MTATTKLGSRSLSKLAMAAVIAGMLVLAFCLGSRPSIAYLVAGLGALGLLAFLQRPGLALVALTGLCFTVPLSLSTGTEVEITFPVLLIAAVAIVWVLDGIRHRRLRLPASTTTLPLVLFLASGLLSLLAGNAYWDPFVPRSGNFTLVQLAQWGIFALSGVAFLLAGELGMRGDGRWLRYATWTFLVLGSIVVLEFYLPSLRRSLGWSDGTMANRSMFWTWLAALSTGQLVFNRRLRPAARLGLVVLLLLSSIVVWFTLRDWVSGWVPFTVAAATVIWLRAWKGDRTAGLALGVVLVASAIVLYPLVFQHAGGERELEVSWGGRQVLYRAVLDLANRHPLLGLGPASYRAYGLTQPLAMGYGHAYYVRPQLSSHNNFIDIYAQMGLVGVALFMWFLAAVARTGWRLLPRFRGDFYEGYVHGAIGGFAGTLVAMLLADWFLPFVYNIGFPGFRTSALAWVFLGGLVAIEARGRESDGATESASRGGAR